MNEKDVDDVAQDIFKLVQEHNSKQNNREVKINTKYILPENKGYFFQVIWHDDNGSSHPITAIITFKDKKFEFTSTKIKKRADLEELPELFAQAFSQIPKKNEQTN